ncbi:MAG: acyl-ACP--UDP-N-acetylglucosamine O-acyltransferase [Deltaproteobacteria bacterium]|nr:acyl-ACP--UDP-N-acetylglucosamine O-acyltransferase [Deltaproteobacteria bacterium]
MSISVHPTAIVSESAVIGEGSTVGPYSIIGPKVVLGTNNRVGPHVVIEGNTRIGNNNQIFQFASVGSAPQDLKYRGEESTLVIGDNNAIREGVTLNPGTAGGGMETRIGDRNLFMAMSHVGHDGVIGNDNVFANSAALAGHVWVGNGVIVGGLVGIHQFVRLGDLCILSGGTMVVKDIPPFCMAQGDRCGLIGINRIGLERRGFSREQILELRSLYREIFFKSSGLMRERVDKARPKYGAAALGKAFLDFFSDTQRGLTFPRKGASDGGEEE